ncbi:hypothetical protein F2Q70_00013111 [Brassica cretica]|uniref:MATH domain-containing protein n=1 Tax=Brassica cretica TaxID=69181 RepID=A0A8S9M5S1_BRACR|nr:hypothetical protein F2Q70_00013111 [Brassica cretica]
MFLLFGRIIIFLSSNVFSPSSCCLLSFVPLARIGLCGAQRFSMMAQHTFPCGWTDWGSWKHRLSAAGFHFITPVLWLLGFSSLFQVAILVFAGIAITGTAFGFWTVRKFLVSEHGGVDNGFKLGSSTTIVKKWREHPPSSYSLKVDSFKQLEKFTASSNDKYQSRLFSSCGYNW